MTLTKKERCPLRASLLLPSPAECIVKLDRRKALIQPGLPERKLCRKIICLACKDLQIAGDSAFVTKIRQVCGVLGIMSQQLLMLAILAIFLVCNQRVRYITGKRLVNRSS